MKKLNLIILGIALISIVFTGCVKQIFWINGEGNIVDKTLELSEFKSISNSACIDVYISQGDTQEVIASGHENIINRLKTNVIGDKWNIELLPGNYRNFELTLYITVTDLSSVKINGSGDIEINGFNDVEDLILQICGSGNIYVTDTIFADNVEVNIDGSGNIELTTVTEWTDANINGSGSIEIDGTSTEEAIKINGSGDYKAFDLICSEADIDIMGSGDVEVNVADFLDIHIMGSGNVYYIGYPRMNLKVDGSGSVISWN